MPEPDEFNEVSTGLAALNGQIAVATAERDAAQPQPVAGTSYPCATGVLSLDAGIG